MEEDKYTKNNGRIRLEPKIRRTRQNKEQYFNDSEDSDIKSFDVEKFIKRNALRLIISIIIFALVFAINSLPFSVAQKVSQGVKWAVTYHMDWEEDVLERRNIVPAISDQIKKFVGTEEVAVGGEVDKDDKYISPVDGVVVSRFQDSVHPIFNTKIEARGIEIKGESARNIRAIDNGIVLQLQDSLYGGKRIVIQHDDLTKCVYEGCYDISLKLNQEINEGDNIGKTKNIDEGGESVFYFELWKEDKAVNPLDYMDLEVDTVN
jgi:murein DD-endopeptidase MepM/ murein hydrolase activator NlpD